MTCQCTQPGHCPSLNRRVRWADIQTCPHDRLTEEPRDCRQCRHAGDVIVDASGNAVGSTGCGCSGQSKASGDTWLTCSLTGKPVRAVRAARCDQFEKR